MFARSLQQIITGAWMGAIACITIGVTIDQPTQTLATFGFLLCCVLGSCASQLKKHFEQSYHRY